MVRKSRSNPDSFLDDFFAVLMRAPMWFGPVCAAGIFVAMRWLIPWSLAAGFSDQEIFKLPVDVFGGLSAMFAPWFAGLALVIWIIAEVRKWTDRRRLDSQTDAQSIAALSWSEFESLISEAFRRQGFTVEQIGGSRPDGGVDHRLHKAGELVLVQCKHWKAWKVGVKIVRELLGVVTSEGAQAGIVVTSGRFTQEAREFAAKTPIRLIDGTELLTMIRGVQANRATITANQPPSNVETPPCPKCGTVMTRRTAKRGANAGSQFWGCPRFPKCRGTLELNSTRFKPSEN